MSLVEFEKHKVVKSFMDTLDVYYTNLGGYHYSKDDSPCYYLNGMLTMFEEQQKNIDLLENEIVETQEFLNKQNHIKQAKIDEMQKRVDGALFEMQQLSLMLSKGIDGYEDPAQICQSEGVDMGVRILEKALRGEHESN